jgi:hypothetical protein
MTARAKFYIIAPLMLFPYAIVAGVDKTLIIMSKFLNKHLINRMIRTIEELHIELMKERNRKI